MANYIVQRSIVMIVIYYIMMCCVMLFKLTTCIKFFDGALAFPPIVYTSSPNLSANRVYLHSHNMKC